MQSTGLRLEVCAWHKGGGTGWEGEGLSSSARAFPAPPPCSSSPPLSLALVPCRPFPGRCHLRAPRPTISKRMWRVLDSQPGRLWTGRRWGQRRPPSWSRLSIVSPLSCPAAQSLAPAYIPAVTLWVSGLELVSVRGTEFSQDLKAFWGQGLVGTEPMGTQRPLPGPPCCRQLVVTSLSVSGLYFPECSLQTRFPPPLLNRDWDNASLSASEPQFSHL